MTEAVYIEGKMHADLIIMTRLTECLKSIKGHDHKPITESPLDGFRTPSTAYSNCPRCGINRGFTWSEIEQRVIALL